MLVDRAKCATCKSTGKMTCTWCAGAGYLCHVRDGTPCQRCDGTGKCECTCVPDLEKGEKKMPVERSKCGACEAVGYTVCIQCEGVGELAAHGPMTCPACKGTGRRDCTCVPDRRAAIDTTNKFLVGARGDTVVIVHPQWALSKNDALLLAAQLVSCAAVLMGDRTFEETLAAVQGAR